MNDKIGSLSNYDINYLNKDYYEHKDDGETYDVFGIIAMIDVLGWKNTIKKEKIKEYFDIINELRSNLIDVALRCVKNPRDINVRINTMSDTILIAIDRSENSKFSEINIFPLISDFITMALEKGFAFRGAISRGYYTISKRGNVIVGEPYYELVKYSEATNWAGVILANSIANALLKNNDLKNLYKIRIVKYNKIPYKENVNELEHNLVLYPMIKKNNLKYNVDAIKKMYDDIMNSEERNVIEKLFNTKEFLDYVNSLEN